MDTEIAKGALIQACEKFRETAAAFEAGVINWETYSDELPELAGDLAQHAEDLLAVLPDQYGRVYG